MFLNYHFILFLKLLLMCTAGLLSLTACQSEKKPSVLVIAIDRLSFNSFSCSDDKSNVNSGLSVMCREAMRFTHAYTTSTQTAGAVGSLLTGLYPYQHHLHRSFDRIDFKATQIQSLALGEGYRTAFWSGSPALLKKTGLSKDFDLFDDAAFLEKRNYFSDLKTQGRVFLNWSKESKLSYFALIHNSELESLNEGGSEISSFEKMDENLASFFTDLKNQDLWENNYVIVTGLQGQSAYNRVKETPFSNLHSENTNVLLFIKPPRQKGDEGINWKIDASVSLADVGFSLMKTIKSDFLIPIDLQFPIWDFSYLWRQHEPEINANVHRQILIEAANTWRPEVENRFAVLFKNLIYIENSPDEIYNLLTDGLETINLSKEQSDFLANNLSALALIRQQNNLLRWQNYEPKEYDWVLANREYWSKPNNRETILRAEVDQLLAGRRSQPLSALALQWLHLQKRQSDLEKIPLPPVTAHENKSISTPVEKETFFADARRQSLNLSLENIWGIWSDDKPWVQSALIKEYQ
ncbi:MAG: sulfatase-like hydrolase/transferase [Bdellovibrionaceae bacterium]|nr:sulfatase-like hydrolase/transferase [Bdellovibrio sp.]